MFHFSLGSIKDKRLSLESSPLPQKIPQIELNLLELSENYSLNLEPNFFENDFLQVEKSFQAQKSPQFCLEISETQIKNSPVLKTPSYLPSESPLSKKKKHDCFLFKSKLKIEPKTGCTCAKSMCLRMHCKCFSLGNTCSEKCGCVNCFNNFREEFKTIRQQAIKLTKEIDKNAFDLKRKKISGNLEISTVGCKCKTGCESKHCFCYKFGLGCSPICKCERCLNARVELDQEVVRKVKLKGSRIKQKIVFRKEGEDITVGCDLADSDHFSMETKEFGAILATLENCGAKKTK